jgi:hypothetical protein
MLYCNDELVRLKDENWKYIESDFLKIRKMKNPVRIKTTQKVEINKTGHSEPFSAHAWPLQATVINKNGESETWVYTKNTPRLENGKLQFTKRSIIIEHGDIYLDVLKETDLAYFIINLSSLLKSGLYEIEDLDKKNTEDVEKIGESATLEFFLCSKYSPIYNDDKRLKQLGASWGVPNTENIHINTLRKLLLDKVYSCQRNYSVTKRGIEEFVSEVNGEDPFSEFRSIVQLSIDKNIIGWSNKDKGWYFVDSTTGMLTQPIVFVPATNISQKESILIDYIRLNASLFDTLKGLMHSEPENKYNYLNWPELKKLAKERGINSKTMTSDRIIEELLEQDSLKGTVS